jgi:four helix bundle protein
MTPEDLSERLLDFAARVGRVVEAMSETRLGRHVAAQLVRCGTSPGPNYEEACAAESRADFVHKLSICLKELRESRFWMRLICRAELLPEAKLAKISEECTELSRVIAQSIVTAKQSSKKK